MRGGMMTVFTLLLYSAIVSGPAVGEMAPDFSVQDTAGVTWTLLGTAHRCLIYRHLKGLESHLSVDVVHPDMLNNGWTFVNEENEFGATGDSLFEKEYLYQIYQKAQPDVSTSVTVPILWDKKTNQIVNNESSEIIRIFNTGFDELTGNENDYYPETLREEIDRLNESIYHQVNNGVYRCGFAKTQEAYEEAVRGLFGVLDDLEIRLKDNSYVVGNQLTEADLRLVPTLIRFDAVYYVHFKCNILKISEYPNLKRYLNKLFEMPAISETTHFEHIKRHYYYSHESINPHRIIPVGPFKNI